jgi:cation diffusion facilitator family transporter
MEQSRKKNRYGYIEGILSIVGNLLLFGLKYWAGIMSGSLALIADAWHTLSDSASSVIVIGSIKLSSRKADDRHPFGHGRYQQIAAIFIAFILGIIAWEFFMGSIEKFRSQESAQFGTLAIVVTAISIVVKEGLAQYAYHTYRITGFETLKADGWHHRSDALSSLLVLGGILLGKHLWWIDSAMGFMISLMLFYAVFEIIRGSINKLLGEQPDEKMIREIEELIGRVSDRDICPHHFHLHTYGDHMELTFHIRIKGSLDIFTGHEIASTIEETLRKEMQIEATIHIEPFSVESDSCR